MSRKASGGQSRKIRGTVSGLNLQPGADVRKPGSMVLAQNVNFDRPGIATPRNGLQVWWEGGGAFPLTYPIFSMTDDPTGDIALGLGSNGLKAAHGNVFNTINLPAGFNAAAPVERGSGTVHPMASIKGNTYVACESGVARFGSSYADPNTLRFIERAGQLPCFIIDALSYDAVAAGIGPNWMPDQSAVAYQALLKKKDRSGDWIVSAVTGRMMVSNTSGAARAVRLQIGLPVPAGTGDMQSSNDQLPYYYLGYVIELYRTQTVLLAISPTPGDKMQLVSQTIVTSAHIAASKAVVVDIASDLLVQGELYTNEGQGGVQKNKTIVPRAFDLCVWKERLWGLGYRGPQRFDFQIVAILGTNGMQIGDTLVFDDGVHTTITLTANTDFTLVNTFALPAQNMEATARNIVQAMNLRGSWLRAFYASIPSDPLSVGRIRFETLDNTTTKFFVRTNNPRIAYMPDIPNSNSVAVQSTGDDWPDAVWFSETREPDAVPLSNVIRVGAANRTGIRIVPTRDRIYVFKTDGVYTITGDNADTFTTTLLDPTLLPIAPESIVQYDSGVTGWFTTGILHISDAGAKMLSSPINDYLLKLAVNATTLTTMYRYARAAQDNTNKRYVLVLPDNSGAKGGSVCLVYNGKTNEWGQWYLSKPVVSIYESLANVATAPENVPTRKLYFGAYDSSGTTNLILSMRRSGAATDFLDTTTWNAGAGTQTTGAIACEVDHVVESEGDSTALKQFVEAIVRFEASNQVPSDLAMTAYAGDPSNPIASLGPVSMGAPSGLVSRGIRRSLIGINGSALTLKFTWSAGGLPSSAQFQNYLGYTLEERDFGGDATP